MHHTHVLLLMLVKTMKEMLLKKKIWKEKKKNKEVVMIMLVVMRKQNSSKKKMRTLVHPSQDMMGIPHHSSPLIHLFDQYCSQGPTRWILVRREGTA